MIRDGTLESQGTCTVKQDLGFSEVKRLCWRLQIKLYQSIAY